MDDARRRFVLEQNHLLLSLLKTRVLQLRRILAGGRDLAEVLDEESQAILSSGSTVEQLAAGVASMVVWLAGTDYDMDVDPFMVAAVEVMAVSTPVTVRRGGIRFDDPPRTGDRP